MPRMEFHISRAARDRYAIDQTLFSLSGNVVLANFHAARLLAQKMNATRDLVTFPERAVRAGQINAMGLIDEILHYVVTLYRRQRNPQVMVDALEYLYAELGEADVDETLRQFVDEFPPVAVYKQEIDLDTYLEGETDDIPNRALVLEEVLLLWLANTNPAFVPFRELFDDSCLEKTSYPRIVASMRTFFDSQPGFGPSDQNLVKMLRSPAQAVPHSLSGQLEYIRGRWGPLLGRYFFRLLSSLDLIAEEEKAIFGGAGPARVYEFAHLEHEPERFSPDREWMPNVVLIAKNSYVWLDQLSKTYGRTISRLDQVPDEELDRLARWGFTGLWLIGIWERSEASKRIKHLLGNPDAVASAYSLRDYRIADALGGEEAYQDLHRRARARGIRLASDMVPNHMGIDSDWVIEHPDWFISLDYSPFPSYTFNGPDLNADAPSGRVGIYLEDHYYDRTDAAVVFKRVDHWTGDETYIYHGNDGTSMPWNDTAQLNFLKEEVREAVVQTILHVARKFSIVRFDAAMTLTKKHYQRLWFPEPGTGGAIPSRAEHGLTKEAFDALMPKEFWREVVERVQEEVPDTLLLAEAFWLMEGYFVRTLGMHRVYNSAFMNMLRDEENSKYRSVIKNTLEFDPEILKRYVNFMNNPDEDTAIAQFGDGDKYFGVCMLMATMPGLPMFGHGQIEGFAEKYGMEYQRAYWDESPDQALVERHEREIFPLLRKRYLFAGVENFLLYDFYAPGGHVNEDVFAYSNRVGDERSLVVYHNKWAEARGWIRTSVASLRAAKGPDERRLVQKHLGEGLGLRNDADYYTIFRDHISGLEYIRNNRDLWERGLYVELGAYKYHVFLDFREVADNEWHQYMHLTSYLDGRGVPSIDQAMKEFFLEPVHQALQALLNETMVRRLMQARLVEPDEVPDPEFVNEVERKAAALLSAIRDVMNAGDDEAAIAATIRETVEAILQIPSLAGRLDAAASEAATALEYLDARAGWATLFSWAVIHPLGALSDPTEAAQLSRSWIDELLLGKLMADVLRTVGVDDEDAWRQVHLIKLLVSHQNWFVGEVVSPKETQSTGASQSKAYRILHRWLADDEVQWFLGVNRHQGVLWFNKEAFEELLWWMSTIAVVKVVADVESTEAILDAVGAQYQIIAQLLHAADESGYQVEALLDVARV